MARYSQTAAKLLPHLLQELSQVEPIIIAAAGGGGSLAVHDLSGAYHTGTLAESQAPWAVTATTFAAHEANTEAHHATATAGSGISIAGQQISLAATVAGAGLTHSAGILAVGAGTLISVAADTVGVAAGAAYQFIGTGSDTGAEWRNVSELAGNGLTAAAGVLAVGVSGLGLGVGADAVTLTSSSNPGEAAAILASDSTGKLTLYNLKIQGVDSGITIADRTGGSNWLLYVNGSDLRFYQGATIFAFSGDGRISTADNMSLLPAGDLTLNPGGGEIFIPGADTMRSEAWTSGVLGTGWGIQERGGAGRSHLDIRSIYCDELIATTFTADQVRVRSGSDWLGEALAIAARDNSDNKVTIPNVGGGSVRIYVENVPEITGQIFDSNEYVLIKTINRSTGLVIRETWGQVSSYIAETGGRQSYSWTTVSGSGNFTLEPGTALTGFGVSSGSYIFRTVIETGRGPFERFATWSGNPYTPANRTSRVEIGDIKNAVGDSTTRYGLAVGNNLALTPTTGFSGLTSDSVYGAQFWNGAIKLHSGGTQKVNVSATGTDVWIGASSADKRLSWDGGTLTVKGAIVVQAGSTGIGTFGDAGTLATVDNLDGVPEGTTYRRTTVNEKTGAGRAYSALDSSNRLITQIDPGTAWGANPGAGVAGLLLGSDYMGYWNGTAWKSYLDNAGRFYLNSGGTSNYLSWNGTTLAVHGAITVTGGNANITVGSGTKDSDLDGWNIGASEIVGQLNGADQVVMNANGQILAGSSTVRLSNAGVEILRGSGSAVNRLLFVSSLGGEQTARITCYTDSSAIAPYYNTNVLILEPLTSTGKAYRHTRVVGDLVVSGGISAEDTSTVWHAGNDGTGSGLDADTIDGVQESALGRLAVERTWTARQIYSVANSAQAILMQAPSGYLRFYPYFGGGAIVQSIDTTETTLLPLTIGGNPTYFQAAAVINGTSVLYSAALTVNGNIHATGVVTSEEYIQIEQRSGAPAAASGFGRIYVDSTDGDLKIIFGNGTVKTIATN